jgi:hypothetical protein
MRNDEKQPQQFLDKIRNLLISNQVFAVIFGLAGIITYFIIAIQYAHNKLSFLDEGLLLFKGYLFSTGQFTPYADFGVRTNQLPLAFLIPGQIQEWFGPGLQTGRYFSIFLSILMLVGLWLTVKKLAGSWWATGAVWAYALNPASIKIYTIAITQGCIAFMFIWLLFLSLNEKQSLWKTGFAGLITSIMVLTRLNMIIVFPLLALFFWWRYGFKHTVIYFISGLIILVIGHTLFWPGILQVWAGWLPKSITPFLDPWRKNTDGVSLQYLLPNNADPITERFTNFWLVIRLHFAGVFGAIAAALLFPKINNWRHEWKLKTAFFLTVLFFILFIFHLYVTFGMDYCVSCIILYTSFFDFTGILAFILVVTSLNWNYPPWRKALMVIVICSSIIGMVYTAIEDFIRPLVQQGNDNTFRLGSGLFSGLIGLVQDLLGIRYYPALRIVTFGVIITGIILLIIGYFILFHKKSKAWGNKIDPPRAIVLFMCIGLVLSPTKLLGLGNNFFDCKGDVIKAYEDAGASMMKQIPQGSSVFWEGRSSAIFLYLPGIIIYPPQLNHIHSYFQGGDDTQLLRLGRYNDHLASKWFGEADFILIEKEWVKKWQTETLNSGFFKKIGPDFPLGQCDSAGKLQLYQRISP